jgi:hypothetical protein
MQQDVTMQAMEHESPSGGHTVISHLWCSEVFSKLAFVDVRVERDVIALPQELGNLAHREPQREQLFDALSIWVELAFLDGAFWLAERYPLRAFGGEGFFGPQADESAMTHLNTLLAPQDLSLLSWLMSSKRKDRIKCVKQIMPMPLSRGFRHL